MDIQTITNLAAGAVAIGGVAYGFVQQRDKKRAEAAKTTAETAHQIISVKDELIEVQKERAAAWKLKYEAEHQEYLDYRSNAHKQLNDAQSLVLRHTEENAELRAKTDLTPILRGQEQQEQVSLRMIETLAKIGKAQDLLIEGLTNTLFAHARKDGVPFAPSAEPV